MSFIEVFGFVTGLVSVWLAVKEHVWTWPIGILNSGAWLFLFAGAQLYTDAGLQVVYIVLGVIGWYWWLHGGDRRAALPISRTSRRTAAWLLAALIGGTAAFTVFNMALTSTDVPFWDGLTTTLSLVATFMLTRKLLENWFVWITVDVAYIALYSYKGLYLTAALQVVFIGMCIAGIIDWRRTLREAKTEPEQMEASLA